MSNLRSQIKSLDAAKAGLRIEDPLHEHCAACGRQGTSADDYAGMVRDCEGADGAKLYEIDPTTTEILVKHANGHLLCRSCHRADEKAVTAKAEQKWKAARAAGRDPVGAVLDEFPTLRPPKVRRKKGMAAMEACGGCSATVGMPDPKVIGLFTCGGCGGLVGSCYLGDFHGIVKPRWCSEPNVPQERWRYYDVTTLGSKGTERHHGWFDKTSGCILQTG